MVHGPSDMLCGMKHIGRNHHIVSCRFISLSFDFLLDIKKPEFQKPGLPVCPFPMHGKTSRNVGVGVGQPRFMPFDGFKHRCCGPPRAGPDFDNPDLFPLRQLGQSLFNIGVDAPGNQTVEIIRPRIVLVDPLHQVLGASRKDHIRGRYAAGQYVRIPLGAGPEQFHMRPDLGIFLYQPFFYRPESFQFFFELRRFECRRA